MFEKASRIKLRFATARGPLSAEDLWDLPLAELDALATNLDKSIEGKKEKSYLKTNRVSQKVQLARDILVHIIKTRITEVKAKEDKIVNEQEVAKIEAALSKINEAEFDGLSKEELEGKLAEAKSK